MHLLCTLYVALCVALIGQYSDAHELNPSDAAKEVSHKSLHSKLKQEEHMTG